MFHTQYLWDRTLQNKCYNIIVIYEQANSKMNKKKLVKTLKFKNVVEI